LNGSPKLFLLLLDRDVFKVRPSDDTGYGRRQGGLPETIDEKGGDFVLKRSESSKHDFSPASLPELALPRPYFNLSAVKRRLGGIED